MKFGVFIRTMGPQSTKETIRDCAQAAEALGYDGLFLPDHLCIPPDQTEGSGGRYLEALVTLGFVAGVTRRINLGLGVLVLPYRPALLTAKQIATAQELSGERLIIGAGAGWMRAEFEALNVPFKDRDAIADDVLCTLRELFDSDPDDPAGQRAGGGPFVFLPHPRRPPIWVGGGSPRALKRAVMYGDGWYPMGGLRELRAGIASLTEQARALDRPTPSIIAGITLGDQALPTDDPQPARGRLKALADLGVSYVIAHFGRYAGADEFRRFAERFIKEIATEFVDA
jgi:probable F420-dependent oxidoreductase